MAIEIGTNDDDNLIGTSGDDTINGLDGNDWLSGLGGADFLNGGWGWDFADYSASTVGVTVDLGIGRGTGGDAEGDRLFNIEGIQGTAYIDTLTGNAGGNDIDGGDGNDVLSGGGVTTLDDWDNINGGAGDDTITIKGAGSAVGGAGDDRIIAEWSGAPEAADLDYVSAEYWDATSGIFANLTASGGDNTNGFEVADGQGGTDLVWGVHQFVDSAHDDIFDIDSTYTVHYGVTPYSDIKILLTAGDDTVTATGVDYASISYATADGAVIADMQEGTATDRFGGTYIGNDTFSGIKSVRGSGYDDELHGSDGDDQIRGRQGNDDILGGAGNDRLYGDEKADRPDDGDDRLDGGDGADQLYGGAGFDTAFYWNSTAGVTVDLAAGTGAGGEAEGDQLFGIEGLVGSDHNDVLTGDAGSNELYGNAGNDQLYGGGVTNIDDWDYIEGGEGNDTITIKGMGEAFGGDGDDRIAAQWSGAPEAADLDFVVANYSDAQADIFADLTVSGGDVANGFAVVDGLGGTDHVSGIHRFHDGDFDDIFHIDGTYLVNYGGNIYNNVEIMLTGGDDSVVATGVEVASVSYSAAGGAVLVNMQAGTATDLDGTGTNIGHDTFEGITRVRGSSFDDQLHGSDDDDQIRGRDGNDTIVGGDGNDILYGDEKAVSEFGGNDTLTGGHGYDQIFGGAGFDTAVLTSLDGAGHELIRLGDVVYALDYMDHSFDTILDVEAFSDGVQTMQVSDLYAPTELELLSYTASYDDLALTYRMDTGAVAWQYLSAGFFEGREASFDATQYLANWGDLSGAFGSDLMAATAHFLTGGVDEHRLAEDPLDYIASYADLSGAFAGLGFEQMKAAGLSHYQAAGWNEGRRAGIDFDADQYLANNADIAAYFGGDADLATWHFIVGGRDEGRMWEDPLDYIASFGDLIDAFGAESVGDMRTDALAQFLNASEAEQTARRAQIDFDADQYLANYADLRTAFADGYGGYDEDAATLHFIQYGYDEGRSDDPLLAA